MQSFLMTGLLEYTISQEEINMSERIMSINIVYEKIDA